MKRSQALAQKDLRGERQKCASAKSLFSFLDESAKNVGTSLTTHAKASLPSGFCPTVKPFLNKRHVCSKMPTVHLLDYAAGNIRSLVNAIEKLGWEVAWINHPDEVANAEVSKHEILHRAHMLMTDRLDDVEVDTTGRRPFWSLSRSIYKSRLCRAGEEIHQFWKAVHGNMRRSTGTL